MSEETRGTSELSLKRAIGQLLIVGFEGTHLPIPLIGALTKGDIGGVILFARNFESRDQIMALTKGGPAQSTESISYLIYKNGMDGGQFGFQSANAVIFFIVIVAISIFQMTVLNKKEEQL